MHTKPLTRLSTAVLLAASLGSQAATLQEQVATDPGFQYSTERDLWVLITASDLGGNPADLRPVEVLEPLDAEGTRARVLDKGLTDTNGSFERKVRVPANTRQLTVRVGVLGITNTVTLNLDGSGTLTHSFE